jgi:predicted PolB exonuclease-like 3'-5' exonuclease
MNYIVLDLETIKNPEVQKFERFFKKRWEKSEDKELETKDRFLDPVLSMLYCVVLKSNIDKDPIPIVGLNEKDTLEKFWNNMGILVTEFTEPYKLISFNGISFDIPYLHLKSLAYKIPHFQLPCKRYDLSHHFDIRDFLTNFNTYKVGTLEYYAELFGLEFDRELSNSSKVEEWSKTPDGMDKIIIHCIQDVSLTEQIYLRIKECLGN